MKVLVIGGGGREHAIIWKLHQSPQINKIYCAPGNAGIASIAELVEIKAEDIEGLCRFAKENEIDLTIVGPEGPLVMGIVDRFQQEGLKIFGPDKQCSQLEGSKAFSKEFMLRHQIPTARYQEFISLEEAKKAVGIYGYPMVIKADGLAAGKGVVIAGDEATALEAMEEMMSGKAFGEAGNKIVIEEYMTGTETSILCFVDQNTIVPMVSAQDYKKIYDGDDGPNTGGMGTYSPSYLDSEDLQKEIQEKILNPIAVGFKKDGMKYRGILFVGLMLTSEGAKVVEFNTRFGDPETQVVLTRLETDLLEIFESILEDRLETQEIIWRNQKTVCVILAAGGYPGDYEKGKVIHGLEKVDPEVLVFHAGTSQKGEEVVTNGGRILGVTTWAETIEEARKKAYNNVEKIYFEDMYYRKDIAGLK